MAKIQKAVVFVVLGRHHFSEKANELTLFF